MMPDEPTAIMPATKPTSQDGGKYADHEFVRVASKVIKGVERAPYNKFETILVNYDKMKDIKGKRNLTKSEERIYDRTDKLIQKEFDAMFKKADTMLDKLDQTTPAQKGGAPPNDKQPPNADPAATAAAAKSQQQAPLQQQAPPQEPPAQEQAPAQEPAAAAAAAAPVDAGAAADPAAAPAAAQNDTRYLDANRLYRWIVSLLKGLWDWIKGLFTGAFSDKFEQLRKQFSADELFKLFGNNPEKIQKFTGEFKENAEKLQRLVASGIGGAASASIDMILNAFSMSPVFGTTILVWRMFQNMLMIMGASLSVQAANNTFSTNSAKTADPKAAAPAAPADQKATEQKATEQGGGGKANAKNNVTKKLKTDIRQLTRSLKRYMHFPHHRKGMKGTTMSGAGSGYSYT
jgi:hypothetical protein